MRVFKSVKKRERVALLMTWIEEDDFVARRVVVFLVACEEDVGAQIRKHLTYAVNKDIGMLVAIVRIDMLVYFLAYKADKVVRVGLCGQFVCHHIGMYLVFLKSIIQQRSVAEFFITEILTEDLEQIEHKSIYKVCRTATPSCTSSASAPSPVCSP